MRMFWQLSRPFVSRRLRASSFSLSFDSRRVCCTAKSRRFWDSTYSPAAAADTKNSSTTHISTIYIVCNRALRSLYADSICGRMAMSRHERLGELKKRVSLIATRI